MKVNNISDIELGIRRVEDGTNEGCHELYFEYTNKEEDGIKMEWASNIFVADLNDLVQKNVLRRMLIRLLTNLPNAVLFKLFNFDPDKEN